MCSACLKRPSVRMCVQVLQVFLTSEKYYFLLPVNKWNPFSFRWFIAPSKELGAIGIDFLPTRYARLKSFDVFFSHQSSQFKISHCQHNWCISHMNDRILTPHLMYKHHMFGRVAIISVFMDMIEIKYHYENTYLIGRRGSILTMQTF